MDGEQSSLATSEPETRVLTGNPRRRIAGLVVAHVVGGWLLAALVAWARPTGYSLLEAVVIGVVFGQASLLAIWCGFVTLAKWIAPSLTGLPPLFELSLLVLVLAVVGLLSVWPVLGARQPLPAGAIVLVVSAGVGFCVVWSFLHDLEGAALGC